VCFKIIELIYETNGPAQIIPTAAAMTIACCASVVAVVLLPLERIAGSGESVSEAHFGGAEGEGGQARKRIVG
jgi:hypothetical protein